MYRFNTVYLLGSGFSKAAGAPLGSELMEKVFGKTNQPNIKDIYDWVSKNIFPGRRDWQAICEIDELISRLSLHCHYNSEHCPQTAQILNMLIQELARSVNCILDTEDKNIYQKFIDRIKNDDAVISLNYDTILERCGIYHKTRHFLKLHGSIDCSYCSNCKTIYPDPRWKDSMERCKCGCRLLPYILPPQVTISTHIEPFLSNYSQALLCLQNAKRLIIIGYSLPITDFDVKLLLKLGIDKNNLKIYIINGPESDLKNYKFLRSHLIKIKLTAEEWLNSRVSI